MKFFLFVLFSFSFSCEGQPQRVPPTKTKQDIPTSPKQPTKPPLQKTSISDAPKITTEKAAPKPSSAGSKFHPNFRKGIALGLFVSKKDDPKYELSIYKKMLKEIVATGATDLSLPVRWKQKNISESEIFPSPEITVSDTTLIAVIEEAKSLGLRIFLMPYIYLKERGNGKWRGTIAPKDRKEWWNQYRKFIYHYADIASAHNVSTYSVGSELNSMHDPKEWAAIINELRKKLPQTELTYSGNWDRFETFPRWGDLDIIGISTYPPLSKASNPSLKQLNAGWGRFKSRIRDLRRRFPKKKILLTEIGYSASKVAARTPWVHAKESDEVDENFQVLLYTSLLETWSKPKYVEGMFIWNWFGRSGPEYNGFSPRGKKAEVLLREWY